MAKQYRQLISKLLSAIAGLILVFFLVIYIMGKDTLQYPMLSLGEIAFISSFVAILLYRRNILAWTFFVVILILVLIPILSLSGHAVC